MKLLSCRYDGVNDKPVPPLPIKPGDTVKIYMRRNLAKVTWWVPSSTEAYFGKLVVEVVWNCPHCDNPHHLIIPESWIADGKAHLWRRKHKRNHHKILFKNIKACPFPGWSGPFLRRNND